VTEGDGKNEETTAAAGGEPSVKKDAIVELTNIIDGNEIRPVIVDAMFKSDGGKRSGEEVTEVRIPAHTSTIVNVRLRPLIGYTQTEIAFSIKGDQDQKPLVHGVLNEFIKRGKHREADPDTDERHYIDYNDTYRISGRSEQTAGKPYAIGYKVEARDPGEYNVVFKVATLLGGGVSARKLTIVVE
jgi:hypothetical protein